MFYLMSQVRVKLEKEKKKQINNERQRTGEGTRGRWRGCKCEKKRDRWREIGRERVRNLVWGFTANRSEGPFEVCTFSAVNSLKTHVMFECEASWIYIFFPFLFLSHSLVPTWQMPNSSSPYSAHSLPAAVEKATRTDGKDEREMERWERERETEQENTWLVF